MSDLRKCLSYRRNEISTMRPAEGEQTRKRKLSPRVKKVVTKDVAARAPRDKHSRLVPSWHARHIDWSKALQFLWYVSGVVCLMVLPACSGVARLDGYARVFPAFLVSTAHTLYTCLSFRKDARHLHPTLTTHHSFITSFFTTVAGSCVGWVVLCEPPSFIQRWRQADNYENVVILIIPWALVHALPSRVFDTFMAAPGGVALAARVVVYAFEALNKFHGLTSGWTKASQKYHLVEALLFVAVRGAASNTMRFLDKLATGVGREAIWKDLRSLLTEHVRYLVIAVMLCLTDKRMEWHPSYMVVEWLNHTICRRGESRLMVSEVETAENAMCAYFKVEHVCEGTNVLLLMYLFYVYCAKALPVEKLKIK